MRGDNCIFFLENKFIFLPAFNQACFLERNYTPDNINANVNTEQTSVENIPRFTYSS